MEVSWETIEIVHKGGCKGMVRVSAKRGSDGQPGSWKETLSLMSNGNAMFTICFSTRPQGIEEIELPKWEVWMSNLMETYFPFFI